MTGTMRGPFAIVVVVGSAVACTYAFDVGPPASSVNGDHDARAPGSDDGGPSGEASVVGDAGPTGCSPPGCTCATGSCDLGCPLGGKCTFVCQPHTSCDTSCVSGTCLTRCESNAACDVACVGGDCSAQCAAGSVCEVACPSGHCTIECQGGQCSFSYCPSNDCRCSGPGCT